jgi:hypothetical protein
MIKKIFWGQKMPLRLLYERGWGTTISPLDEVHYIVICLCETISILGRNRMKLWTHLYKKIFPGKKCPIG